MWTFCVRVSVWHKAGVTLGPYHPTVGCICWPLVNLDSKEQKFRHWMELKTVALCSLMANKERNVNIFHSSKQCNFWCWLPKLPNSQQKQSQRLGGMCPVRRYLNKHRIQTNWTPRRWREANHHTGSYRTRDLFYLNCKEFWAGNQNLDVESFLSERVTFHGTSLVRLLPWGVNMSSKEGRWMLRHDGPLACILTTLPFTAGNRGVMRLLSAGTVCCLDSSVLLHHYQLFFFPSRHLSM